MEVPRVGLLQLNSKSMAAGKALACRLIGGEALLGQPKITMNVYLVVVIGLLVIWGSIATGIVIARDIFPSVQSAALPPNSIFRAGKPAPIKSALVSLDGRNTRLVLGHKATVVLAMATWCKFCGYMDKWVLPDMSKEAGVAVDVVDVSPSGGIADPGPQQPAFSGTDGSGSAGLSESAMEADLRTYTAKYGIARSGINFYVAPASTQQQWHIAAFPTVVVLTSDGTVSMQQSSAMTLAQLNAAVQSASTQ